jgi:hypothetical protein
MVWCPLSERSASASTWEGEKEKQTSKSSCLWWRPDLGKNFRYPSRASSAILNLTASLHHWWAVTVGSNHKNNHPCLSILCYSNVYRSTRLQGICGRTYRNSQSERHRLISEVSNCDGHLSPSTVSPPYRGGGVWVLLRPWELCRL